MERLFAPEQRDVVCAVLVEQCGTNLPLYRPRDAAGLERVRFAVLKLSAGNLDTLREMAGHAKRDWRDVLVWAGFGDSLSEHERWAQSILDAHGSAG